MRNGKPPVFNVLLSEWMSEELWMSLIALNIHTVGQLLFVWRRSPADRNNIEQLFDSPAQAHQAIRDCAGIIGLSTWILPAELMPTPWYRQNDTYPPYQNIQG